MSDEAEVQQVMNEWLRSMGQSTVPAVRPFEVPVDQLVYPEDAPKAKLRGYVPEPVLEEEVEVEPEAPVIPRKMTAYAEFADEWKNAKTTKAGVTILGKRVSKAAAKELAGKAVKVLAEHFSVCEVARILNDPRLGLDAYFDTLRSIRDNIDASAKDRMAAADKIMQTILSILKAHTKEEPLPDTLSSTDGEATKNLMAVLVNVQRALPEAQPNAVQVTQFMEPAIPHLLEAETTEVQ